MNRKNWANMKHHIHVKTFKKPAILHDFLASLEAHGYAGEGNIITVGDDNPGQCLDILEKFPFVDAYLTGNVNAIWANNNRGIKYFLESTDADALLLVDHDIEFVQNGILREIEKAHAADKQEHITTFARGTDGINGLQVVFPYIAQSTYLNWHPGCHGYLFWQTRELVQKVGYQLKFSYFYGAEHAEYSHRCLAAQGYSDLQLYPVLKRSDEFYKLNPKDFREYEVDYAHVMATNQQEMHNRDAQTIQGHNLLEQDHHLDKEIIVRSGSSNATEEVSELLSKAG